MADDPTFIYISEEIFRQMITLSVIEPRSKLYNHTLVNSENYAESITLTIRDVHYTPSRSFFHRYFINCKKCYIMEECYRYQLKETFNYSEAIPLLPVQIPCHDGTNVLKKVINASEFPILKILEILFINFHHEINLRKGRISLRNLVLFMRENFSDHIFDCFCRLIRIHEQVMDFSLKIRRQVSITFGLNNFRSWCKPSNVFVFGFEIEYPVDPEDSSSFFANYSLGSIDLYEKSPHESISTKSWALKRIFKPTSHIKVANEAYK